MEFQDFDPSESNPGKLSIGEQTETTNLAGGKAFDTFTPEFGLYKVVINNLLEDSYYEDVDESFQKVFQRYNDAVDADLEFPLQLAAYARQEQGYRDIAQLILVLAANDDRVVQSGQERSLVREYTPAIIDRMDEFNTVISYQIRMFGKPVPTPLQNGMEDALHKKYAIITDDDVLDGDTRRTTWIEGIETFVRDNWEVLDEGYIYDEYTASKYMERDKEVTLYDVINLVRPNPRSDNRNDLFRKIAYGEVDEGVVWKDHWRSGDAVDASEVERLTQERTWEATRSDDEDDRSEYEQWHDRLEDMGLMARVRNLRNMREAGLSGSAIFSYDVKGVGPDGTGGVVFGDVSEQVVQNSQMFPFRFYQAYKACTNVTAETKQHYRGGRYEVDSDSVLDQFSRQWLEGAMEASIDNLPDTLDNTFVAVDLSGSMDYKVSGDSELACAEIGALFGAILMKRGCDVGVFADDFAIVEEGREEVEDLGVLETARRIFEVGDQVGGSTNGWKVTKWLVDQQQEYDRVVFLTDMQIWDSTSRWGSAGSSVKEYWDQYVQDVKPDSHLYTIDLKNYGELQMPENYDNVHQISGWNSNVVEFIDKFEQAEDVIAEIKEIQPTDY